MKIEAVIFRVNNLCNASDFANARTLITSEWNRITESKNYGLLNESAKQFVKILKEEKEITDFDKLSLDDKRVLNRLNEYVRDTKFSHAKMTYHKHKNLFETPEAKLWLTRETKIMIEAFKNAN